MKVIFFSLLGIACMSSCAEYRLQQNTKNDITADTQHIMRILTYGFAPKETSPNDTIAKKFGFYYYPVADCVIRRKLLDSILTHNDSVYKLLEMRFGANWRLVSK